MRMVENIKQGTVIDHIPSGKALDCLDLLCYNNKTRLFMAVNVPSNKMISKDILKLENVFLSEDEINKIAIIAPIATVSIIENEKIVKKFKVELPNQIKNFQKCVNPKCVTNTEHYLQPLHNVNKKRNALECAYCERTLH